MERLSETTLISFLQKHAPSKLNIVHGQIKLEVCRISANQNATDKFQSGFMHYRLRT